MFDAFGPLPPDVWFEDDVITLRAWLFGRIVFMDEALVRYREHESNIFNRVTPAATTWHARKSAEHATSTEARRRRISLLAFLPSLALAVRQQRITQALHDELARHVETRCAFLQIIEGWWTVGWAERFAALGFVARFGRASEVRWCVTRLLPFPAFVALGAVWGRARWLGQMVWTTPPGDQSSRRQSAS
jgi:hypothetical protein